jgi:hypothetical protein
MNRVFYIALLISFIWHFICIAAVNIVTLPGKFRPRTAASISFLGPILAFDVKNGSRHLPEVSVHGKELRLNLGETVKEAPPLFDIAKGKIEEIRAGRILNTPFPEAKSVPDSGRKAVAKSGNSRDDDIFGALAGREIFYKPPKPAAPEWAAGRAPFNLEFKFLVSAQGEVREVVPVVSSGIAEIDLLGIRYLKGWKFTPLVAVAGSLAPPGEWGNVKIILAK